MHLLLLIMHLLLLIAQPLNLAKGVKNTSSSFCQKHQLFTAIKTASESTREEEERGLYQLPQKFGGLSFTSAQFTRCLANMAAVADPLKLAGRMVDTNAIMHHVVRFWTAGVSLPDRENSRHLPQLRDTVEQALGDAQDAIHLVEPALHHEYDWKAETLVDAPRKLQRLFSHLHYKLLQEHLWDTANEKQQAHMREMTRSGSHALLNALPSENALRVSSLAFNLNLKQCLNLDVVTDGHLLHVDPAADEEPQPEVDPELADEFAPIHDLDVARLECGHDVEHGDVGTHLATCPSIKDRGARIKCHGSVTDQFLHLGNRNQLACQGETPTGVGDKRFDAEFSTPLGEPDLAADITVVHPLGASVRRNTARNQGPVALEAAERRKHEKYAEDMDLPQWRNHKFYTTRMGSYQKLTASSSGTTW